MIETRITIRNKAGLHARAASRLVEVTSRFNSRVRLGNDKQVDAKSILSLMMLAASQGTELGLVIEGDDENQALQAIEELINNRFDENE